MRINNDFPRGAISNCHSAVRVKIDSFAIKKNLNIVTEFSCRSFLVD